ncbi:MAG: hypothetical protein JWO74_1529 [Solirubrobacterales bacterium]|nr:hypothetical protein [Solirubrobacterales bacterium]
MAIVARTVRKTAPLDRTSPVPLYYQLQEAIHQQIESGVWRSGEPLPTEHELCRLHGVSRACVRQALALLEADRAIVRRRGLGTFVAPVRNVAGVRGLVRTLVTPGPYAPRIRVIDRHLGGIEESVSRTLQAAPEGILRLTTLWRDDPAALAIGVSFVRLDAVPWLDGAAAPGRELTLSSPPPPIAFGEAEVAIETSACGAFEAALLGIDENATLMVTASVHWAAGRPIEVMRLSFPGDRVQLHFRGTPVTDAQPAAWAFGPR